jgi:hypothetical protein
MLQLDPSHRPSIEDIMAHPWMKGPIPSKEQIIAEFQQRDVIVKEAVEQDKLAKKAE